MNKIEKGNIEDLKAASTGNVSLTLVKKDFSGKIIDKINLENSLLAKVDFSNSNIYNCSFEKCEFTKVSFKNATLSIITFANCTFYNVDFSNCIFKNITFDGDCKFVKCEFDSADLSDNVSGLSDKDLHVIVEQSKAKTKILEDSGLEKQADGTFKCDLGDDVVVVAYHDPDMEQIVWRMTFFVNNEPIFTSDFYLDKRLTISYLKEQMQYGKRTALEKINTLEENI